MPHNCIIWLSLPRNGIYGYYVASQLYNLAVSCLATVSFGCRCLATVFIAIMLPRNSIIWLLLPRNCTIWLSLPRNDIYDTGMWLGHDKKMKMTKLKITLLTEYISFNFIIKRIWIRILKCIVAFTVFFCLVFISLNYL